MRFLFKRKPVDQHPTPVDTATMGPWDWYDFLLAMTDGLEDLAKQSLCIPDNGPHKFVACRLLVDAAAHTRGAAAQMYDLAIKETPHE